MSFADLNEQHLIYLCWSHSLVLWMWLNSLTLLHKSVTTFIKNY